MALAPVADAISDGHTISGPCVVKAINLYFVILDDWNVLLTID